MKSNCYSYFHYTDCFISLSCTMMTTLFWYFFSHFSMHVWHELEQSSLSHLLDLLSLFSIRWHKMSHKALKIIQSSHKQWLLKSFHPSVSEVDFSIFEFRPNHYTKWESQSKIRTRVSNSVDPDEMAHYEPSHQDLHCLQSIWSSGLKRLKEQFDQDVHWLPFSCCWLYSASVHRAFYCLNMT